jgi:hypothetical protein
MSHVLHIVAARASGLEDVENMGKNDPYVKFSFEHKMNKDNSKRTAAKDNAGANPEWDEVLELGNYDPSRHTKLYVEVFDKEAGIDQPIAFADIPLHQVQNAEHKSFKGRFDLYNDDAKAKGTIHLILTAITPDQVGHDIDYDLAEVQGESNLGNDHQEAFKSAKLKEKSGDAAAIAAAGLAAGLVFKSWSGSKKPKKQ